jgi:hypothetical protein
MRASRGAEDRTACTPNPFTHAHVQHNPNSNKHSTCADVLHAATRLLFDYVYYMQSTSDNTSDNVQHFSA